jgi:FMN phosphatase YigB (HAD superfamily)
VSGAIKGIFCFKRLGVLKPSAEFFNAVVAELCCLPGDIFMVGDDPVNDVRWALDNGAQAVHLCPAMKLHRHRINDAW